jgi:small GTP-binding protein
MRLLTPPGVAGIAVVQVQACERERLAPCLRRPGGGPVATTPGLPPRRAWLQLDGQVVDDVLLVDRGARGLELHLHGSRAVLAALERHFVFEAPVHESPADRLLRLAMSDSQLELAIEQLQYDFDGFCRGLVTMSPAVRARELESARQRTRVALAQAYPARLVLVGLQNAGKSSLFNRLLFCERAITGPMPGLTRDPIAEVTVLDGYPYELCDTAGEGPAASPADAAAIESGRRLRAGALELLVIDGSVGPTPVDRQLARHAALVVASKADLVPAPWPGDLPCHLQVSCAAQDGLLLRSRIGAALRCHRRLPPAGRVGGVAALHAADAARLQAGAGGDCGPTPGAA